MKKDKVRASSIKQILNDQQRLDKIFEASNKEAIDTILNGQVKQSLKDIINESEEEKEDSYEEEEVDTDTADTENPTDDEKSTESTDAATEETEDTETEDAVEDDEKVWGDLESYKTDDGEYDLTNKDMDYVMDIFKKMGPDDEIRVVKDEDDNLQFTQEENQDEFSVNIDDLIAASEEDDEEEPTDGDEASDDENLDDNTEFEIEVDDDLETDGVDSSEDESDDTEFGSNEETTEDEDDVNESTELGDMSQENPDEFVDEQIGANGKQLVHRKMIARNASEKQQRKENHNDKVMAESKKLKNLKRMANSILDENKQMKSIIGKLRAKIEEEVLVNTSMANIIKILTENTTTLDEKASIVKRFNEVKTLSQSTQLYEVISSELKSSHPMNEGINKINTSLNESTNTQNQIVETKLVESEDIKKMNSLLERIDNCYKKK